LYTLDKAGTWAIFAQQDDKETEASAETSFFLLLIPLPKGFADCSLFEQFGKIKKEGQLSPFYLN